jgi:hypothetical protein
MAQTNDLFSLGSAPPEFLAEQERIARKKAMAQLITQQAFKPVGQLPAKSAWLAAVAPALQMYLGNRAQTNADTEQADLANRVREAQSAELLPLQTAQGSELRQGLAKALTSQYAPVRQYAGERQKEMRELAKAGVDATKDLADPASLLRALQTGDLGQIAVGTPRGPYEITLPSGKTALVNSRGKYATGTYAPEGTRVEVNSVPKVAHQAQSKALDHFNYGGKGHEAYNDTLSRLQGNADLLRTLDQNPQMGAGAEFFQAARKWAQTIPGAPVSDTTTPTEMAKMQLGQRVLAKLGGLGAQVSDSDRQFMMETQGYLGSDPEAIRKLALLETKYLMQIQNQLKAGRDRSQAFVGDSYQLPEYGFGLGDASFSEANANELERLMGGKGFSTPARRPGAPAPALAPVGRIRRVPDATN